MLTALGKVGARGFSLNADVSNLASGPCVTAAGGPVTLWQVSYEDVEKLRHLAVFSRTRIPHFMRDQERYLQYLDHIVAVNELDDSALEHLLP